jgi:hypothetical protein
MFPNIDLEMQGCVTKETQLFGVVSNVWNLALAADPRRIGLYFLLYPAYETVSVIPTDVGPPQTSPAVAGQGLLIKNQWQFALDGALVCKNWWIASPNFAGNPPPTVYEQWQIKEPGSMAPAPKIQIARPVVSPQSIGELIRRVRQLGGQSVPKMA